MGVKILQQSGDPVWAQSLTKLHVFGLTQYKRLIYLDADGLVLRNMDHLFSLPDAAVAMPRAYWLSQPRMCNALAVVQPSAGRLEELLQRARTHGELSSASWPAMRPSFCSLNVLTVLRHPCRACSTMPPLEEKRKSPYNSGFRSITLLGDISSDMHGQARESSTSASSMK